MNRVCATLTSLGLGAVAMYYLDPQQGRRRRALVRDQITHFATKSPKKLDAKSRDLSNRASGLYAEARGAITPDRGGQEAHQNESNSEWSSVDGGYVPAEEMYDPDEIVDEAIDESFPASDPPSYSSGIAARSLEPGQPVPDETSRNLLDNPRV